MAVKSNAIPLGFQAPGFRLYDTISQKKLSLDEIRGEKATVIMFICNHCPYVRHVIDGIVKMANDYMPRGIAFIAISSNDVIKYPEDQPDRMKELATQAGMRFPYLYDETQGVAKAYQAECTPEFNIFDGKLRCFYRGQMDDSRPGNGIPVTGNDIRNALETFLQGEKPGLEQKPAEGCSIKWK